MHPNARILSDWLEAKTWFTADTKAAIPDAVLAALKPFLEVDAATEEEQDVYQRTLSTLFQYRPTSSYENRELLGAALIKLGSFSKKKFWRSAVAFLNMAPGMGQENINKWVKELGLDAAEKRELDTELFHAFR